MKDFPNLSFKTQADLIKFAEYVNKERPNDIKDFDNLQNRFMAGRKVGRLPTGAVDIAPDDRLGDFNYTTAYFYIVVDNAGTAEWRRTALSSW